MLRSWLRDNWRWLVVDGAAGALLAFLALRAGVPLLRPASPAQPLAVGEAVDAAALRASGPGSPEAWREALLASVTAAGDYLARGQLSNGELPYQVDVLSGSRRGDVSLIRMVAGAGGLFTTCRLTGQEAYCLAGDAALTRYLGQLVEREDMPGACFYSQGRCALGGDALALDAIYRRWQATGEADLTDTALRLGENIAWLRSDDGGPIHVLDPHFGGTVDEGYSDRFFPGESLMALLELYEMTGDPRWLDEAHQTDDFMLRQEVTEDHWHAYGFAFLARLDALSEDDLGYARQIGQMLVEDQATLGTHTASITAASRVEALAQLSLALQAAGEEADWLLPALQTYALYVMGHQLPDGPDCDWPPGVLARFDGGVVTSCAQPFIRVDGNQHWINGAAGFLELLGQTEGAG